MDDLKIGDIVSADVDGWREGRKITKIGQSTEVYSRPECPFNYCDTEAPHTECLTRCRHVEEGESQGNSEERSFRKALNRPAEVWYPCGCSASPGSPKYCPEHGEKSAKSILDTQ